VASPIIDRRREPRHPVLDLPLKPRRGHDTNRRSCIFKWVTIAPSDEPRRQTTLYLDSVSIQRKKNSPGA
jgi:hypothetical protein